ncbi:MAG: hypothetical protein ACI9LF_001168 [Flavobacteriales bacterium]|jgi:hypothetical protein
MIADAPLSVNDYPEFIRINNKKAFLLDEFPDHHPGGMKYIRFWRDEKRKCIEGAWEQDTKEINVKGMYRWMPPNLYFYVNHGSIAHVKKKGQPFEIIRPFLRDVEWEFFYNWSECRGFSGFIDDDKYHCIRDRGVTEVVNKKKKLLYETEEEWEEYWTMICKDQHGEIDDELWHNYYSRETGKPKEYLPAREYMRKIHDVSLGRPIYANQALNMFLLGSRGFGKSYMVGVGVILHEWVFDGAKEYKYDPDKKWAGKVDIFVGAAIAAKSSDLLSKTWQAFNNMPGSWGEGENYVPPPFKKNYLGTLKANNGQSPFRHQYEKKKGNSTIIEGSGSAIKHGIYTTENPEAAAGGRYTVAAIEEVGLLPNVLTVHGSNEATQIVGGNVIGSSIYIGTGGNMEKIVESEIIFRDPEGFRFLTFDNTYEPNDGGKIGWFVPAIYNINDYKDENGNTNVVKAIEHYNKRREKARNARDKSALALEMMNYPLVPSEMFLNTGLNIFPVADLKMQLSYVVNNPNKYRNLNQVGRLSINPDTKKIDFKEDSTLEEITRFPLKDNKGMPGAVVIREHPKSNEKDLIITGRYLQGTDTYDDDESETNSFGSSWILDTFTDRLVCEFFGRPSTNEFYEITRRMNIYYNAVHNYENNKKGLFTYYRYKNSTHLLCNTPESLKDVENVTFSKEGNKAKGVNASKAINTYARGLLANWLTEPAPNDDDENPEEILMNLHNIWSEGLLRELIYWMPDGNYDRVSSMGMLLIIRADRLKIIENKRKGVEAAETIFEHSFWTRNRMSNDNIYGKNAITRYKKIF